MLRPILIFISVIALIESYSVKREKVLRREWDEFKAKFGKQYGSAEEEAMRFNIFIENKLKIAKHNKEFANGLHSFKMGINHFCDQTSSELKRLNGFLWPNKNPNPPFFSSSENIDVPDEVDWRKKGYVTEVKNQGTCYAGWAFSVTGLAEGMHFHNTKKLVSLSEQNLLDCVGPLETNRCFGGLPIGAVDYVQDWGINTEESYPYEEDDNICRYLEKNVGVRVFQLHEINPSESSLKEAVAKFPISVAIDASHDSFINYKSGIYSDKNCNSTKLNHGVLVVGYGTTPQGQDYWIVKNSFGKSWGENGYIRMARNKDNMCGIASNAFYFDTD